MKELHKMHDMNTYEPMYASTLTYQEIKDTLGSLVFIAEKRNRDIKERNFSFGSNQITYKENDESNGSSPTLNTDSLFLIGVIDAHEHRAVGMLNVKNDFLHAENYEYMLMLLFGKISEPLVKVDPKLYIKYVIALNEGVHMLYVKLTKSLNGMLRSVMVF